jgi:drug/metabolite transporter (DMT)-like permease
MKDWLVVAMSIALTAVCWGIYAPILHWGQEPMGGKLRPFICVGLAYFVVAVMVPTAMLSMGWEPGGKWPINGFMFSFIGGALGAVGALGIILALSYGGKPTYVMPIVFGCAPIFNTLWTAYWSNAFKDQSPTQMSLFFAGIILAVVGAVIVLVFKPVEKKKDVKAAKAEAAAVAVEKVEEKKDGKIWQHPG